MAPGDLKPQSCQHLEEPPYTTSYNDYASITSSNRGMDDPEKKSKEGLATPFPTLYGLLARI